MTEPSGMCFNLRRIFIALWIVLFHQAFAFPGTGKAYVPGGTVTIIISNFAVGASTPTSVTISWVTNVPTTSQGQATNTSTNQVTSSATNSTLVTNHSVTIT